MAKVNSVENGYSVVSTRQRRGGRGGARQQLEAVAAGGARLNGGGEGVTVYRDDDNDVAEQVQCLRCGSESQRLGIWR